MKALLADGKSLHKTADGTADKTKLEDYVLHNVHQQMRKEQGGGAGPM